MVYTWLHNFEILVPGGLVASMAVPPVGGSVWRIVARRGSRGRSVICHIISTPFRLIRTFRRDFSPHLAGTRARQALLQTFPSFSSANIVAATLSKHTQYVASIRFTRHLAAAWFSSCHRPFPLAARLAVD